VRASRRVGEGERKTGNPAPISPSTADLAAKASTTPSHKLMTFNTFVLRAR